MFERFTEKSIKVIMLAQEEARRLGHNFVGTEQILLGLVGEGTGIAAKTLKSFGVNLKDARVEVEKIIGRGSGYVSVEIPFTPRAKRVLEMSWEEARKLGHTYIGTEHLLLGLMRADDGVAVRVLENLGVDLTKIRSNVIRLIAESAPSSKEQQRFTSMSGMPGAGLELPPVDKLSDSTLRSIILAREETRRLGHSQVSPELILLGLVAEEGNFAARTLKEEGVTLKAVRDQVESVIGRGSGVIPVNSPLSAASHELMKVAFERAKSLGQDSVHGGHVFLALLELGDSEVEKILKQLGVEPSKLKDTILAELNKDIAIAARQPGTPTLAEAIKQKTMALAEAIQRKHIYVDPRPDPISKFTEQANKVITHAIEESRQLGHNFVGTEHILLGLIRETAGIAGKALESQGVDLEKARDQVEKIAKRGAGVVAVEMPFTPRTKRVFEHAWDEAKALGHNYIGTEHLLLGLLREGEGVAARALEYLGVDSAKLREKVLELLKEGGTATA